MKLPKKITPDRIKDSIIEFRYHSNFPFEVIIGLIYKELTTGVGGYTFVNRPDEFIGDNGLTPIKITHGGQNIFYNEKIKLQFLPNSIIINCKNNYIGWEEYENEVSNVLEKIQNSNFIEFYTRLGIRYISEYENTDFKNCLNFEFTFAFKEVVSKTYSFKTEFDFNDFNCILHIHNNLVNLNNLDDKISIIDIDIIKDNLKIEPTKKQDFLRIINDAHNNEKQIFYKLLKDNFLAKLNPEY